MWPASRGQELVSSEGVLSPLESNWTLCCVDIASHGNYWPHCLSFNCGNSSSQPQTPLRPCFLPDGRSSFPNSSRGKKTFTSPSRSGFGKLFLPGQCASLKASFYMPSASRCSNGSLWGVRSRVPRWPLSFQDSAYQDEICINENTGILIRNALVIKMPRPILYLVVCLFNRQLGYLWWHMRCIIGTLLDNVSRLQVLLNGMFIVNSFFNHTSCVYQRRGDAEAGAWKMLPSGCLKIRGGSEMDRHSQILSRINSQVTVLLLILYKLPSCSELKWK